MGRFRRLRSSQALRNLVRETSIAKNDVIQPFFAVDGQNQEQSIASMPGIYRYSADQIIKAVEGFIKVGGQSGLVFGVTDSKDSKASMAGSSDNPVYHAIQAIKKEFPDFCIVADVCLCGYTDHGHCGLIVDDKVDNDSTLTHLNNMSKSLVEAGADIIAPSDMMDYRVQSIREYLDSEGHAETPIMSYAVKYQSAYYGPFRDAANSAPQFGDRATYQMDPANRREAIKEAVQDVQEGADIIMVKPALAYLDVIHELRDHIQNPIAAYNVSGEYAMVKAAAEKGWVDEEKIVLETLNSIKRAGADIIISYHAQDVLTWLK